jgi:RsiW-degrading membrane proteinase PrsW (M82 family)
MSTGRSRNRITGLRVAALVVAWYTLPSLVLVYAYCLSHRSRSTTILAVVATVVVVLLIGLAAVFPKGSAV